MSGRWLRRAALITIVAATVLAAVPASPGLAAEAEWDSRLVPLVAQVEELRGLEFEHPVAVELLDDAEFESRVAVDRGKLDEQDRADLTRSEAQLRAMGLVAGGVDLLDSVSDLQQSGVLAYYDPKRERITVRGKALDVARRVTLVHELTHALQDQHFDLESLQRAARRARGSAALQALVEGDASRIEAEYVGELSDGDRRKYDRWKLDTASVVGGELEGNSVPAAIVAIFQSPYVLGAPMLRILVADRDTDAVDELFRHPPRADVSYLEPRTLLDGFDGVDVATPALADGETQSGKPDVFGAFALYLTLAASGDPVRALEVADKWGGDAMVTFTRPDGTTCVRATFAGRNDRAGATIRQALEGWVAGRPDATVVADGSRTTLTACDPGAAAVDPGVAVDAALVAAVLRSELLAQGAEVVGLEASACSIDEALADPTFAPVLAAAAEDPDALPDQSVLGPFQRRLAQITVECAARN